MERLVLRAEVAIGECDAKLDAEQQFRGTCCGMLTQLYV